MVTPGARLLLDFVARAEGTSGTVRARHGYESDYDVTFAYGRAEPAGRPPRLSALTLDAVDALQGAMRGSAAVGRYQIGRTTLREPRARFGLGGEAVFDAELQDRLGCALLRRRGYGRYCAGDGPAEAVMAALAHEWASLPLADGGSAYAFEGRPQPVGASLTAFREALEAARRADGADIALAGQRRT